MKNKEFPKDFLWGASTSAFQVEGGFNEERGIANSDMRHIPDGLADYKTASDHYHHVKEDVQLMKELGMKVYRFSFFWSRIMPDGENVSQKGLDFYHKLIDALLENGIQPFPTLYHFEMPYALIEKYGGWKSRKCVDAYVKYAKICFEEFGSKVKMWATINEQMCATAPDDMNMNLEKDPHLRQKNLFQMSYHMTLAEKIATSYFKEMVPDGKIGHVVAMQVIYPATSAPEDVLAAGHGIVHTINFGLWDLACIGGCGATIGLVIMMFFTAKSERYKAFGKITLPCGIFSVNEPVIFGLPLMLNVMTIIPFIVCPIVVSSVGYLLMKLHIIAPYIGILGTGSLPPFIHGMVNGSISAGIYELVAVVLSCVVWYPFFKMLDKQALEEENKMKC